MYLYRGVIYEKSGRPVGIQELKSSPMQVVVNGKSVETAAKLLGDLLSEQAFAGRKVATAVNGAFVPEAGRANTALKPGDRIEIVSPRQGG